LGEPLYIKFGPTKLQSLGYPFEALARDPPSFCDISYEIWSQKLESLGYSTVNTSWSCVHLPWPACQKDRIQTDGQVDYGYTVHS